MSTPSVRAMPPTKSDPRSRLTSAVYLSIEKRKGEAERIRQKYPDRIPVSITNPFVCVIASSSLTYVWRVPGHLREGGQDGHPHY